MAFSEANLKPFVRVCSSLPGEPHPYSAFWRFRSHCWRILRGFCYTLVNLIVGYILFRVGKVSSGDGSALVIFFAGIVVIKPNNGPSENRRDVPQTFKPKMLKRRTSR